MNELTNPPIKAHQTTNTSQTLKQNLIIKIIIGLIVFFLVLIVIYTFTRPKKATTASSTTGSVIPIQSADVSINSDSFDPTTITVKMDTQVNWTNKDNTVHQVAADPYPKDNSIPNFNNSIILHQGDTISFTFKTRGTYTYHDERNPLSMKGTVIVQ